MRPPGFFAGLGQFGTLWDSWDTLDGGTVWDSGTVLRGQFKGSGITKHTDGDRDLR